MSDTPDPRPALAANPVRGQPDSPIEVAAGVLADAEGRVLLMQRLPGKHLAGRWEFPGGKLEPGETVAQALARELREELGIEARGFAPLISVPWQYPGKAVRLHVLRVGTWSGEPQAREGHPLRWCSVDAIDTADMPAADVPVVTALRLPAHYAIRDGQGGAPRLQPDTLYQLRMPAARSSQLQGSTRAWLAAEPSLRDRLLVNRDIDLARELGIGVHLASAQLRQLRARPLSTGSWVGASCHGAGELELAARLGVDFACLSPVRATASHPGAIPLGWQRFAALVAAARLPVYALGGMRPDDLERARAAGAQGVAGISGFA